MEIYCSDMIEKFGNDEDLSDQEICWISQLKKYSDGRWQGATIEDKDGLIKEYIYVTLVKKSRWLDENKLRALTDTVSKVNRYINKNCGIQSEFDIDNALKELCRIGKVNRELNRFLNNPVLSYEPMVIDIERYKKRLIKSQFRGKNVNTEKGYFIVMEIFSNNALVLKKLYTGRFVKVVLDSELIKCVKPMDIVHMSIIQNYFLGWDIENVVGYYPKEAAEYIIKTGV